MGAIVAQEQDPDTKIWLSMVDYFDGDSGEERHKLQALVGVGDLYREMSTVLQA